MFNKLKIFLGPGKRERDLSLQRKELLERAERAEMMAYNAMAETEQARKERDEAREKVSQLEAELKSLKNG